MSYVPGPGDLMAPFAGHPHDPRTPETDDSDAEAVDMWWAIDDIRDYVSVAAVAAARGDLTKARQTLAEVKIQIEDLIGVKQ